MAKVPFISSQKRLLVDLKFAVSENLSCFFFISPFAVSHFQIHLPYY